MTDAAELTLRDPQSGAMAAIAPARGGIVTRFEIAGRRVLFMDAQTLADPTKNIRGGVPVLFPSPGKLDGDAWSYAGRRGTMKQHGFARNLPWQVAAVTASAATLVLVSDDATRAQFPWDFTVEHAIAVHGRSLVLEQRVTNRGDSAMPFGFGFHPYFYVPDATKRDAAITTRATRAFDNVARQTIALPTVAAAGGARPVAVIDLTQPEVDLHLLDHGSTGSELVSPAGTVRLTGSADYTHWVVWTLAGRDFVCLEPWTCPGNALNTGLIESPGIAGARSDAQRRGGLIESPGIAGARSDAQRRGGLIVLAPGESRALSLEIAA